jgi:hypothetical protein
MDLQSAFDAGFEAVKSYVDAELGDIKKRAGLKNPNRTISGVSA